MGHVFAVAGFAVAAPAVVLLFVRLVLSPKASFMEILGGIVLLTLSELVSSRSKPAFTRRLVSVATGIGGQSRSWRAEEWARDLAEAKHPLRYGLGTIGAALRMRGHDLSRLVLAGICWVLASNVWIWVILIPPMVAALYNVLVQQGWGSAVVSLTMVPVVYVGVERLRKRWGVTVRKRKIHGATK